MSVPRLEQPIIVLGCNRSGTTLLFNNLSAHPDTWSLYIESQDIFYRHHPIHPELGRPHHRAARGRRAGGHRAVLLPDRAQQGVLQGHARTQADPPEAPPAARQPHLQAAAAPPGGEDAGERTPGSLPGEAVPGCEVALPGPSGRGRGEFADGGMEELVEDRATLPGISPGGTTWSHRDGRNTGTGGWRRSAPSSGRRATGSAGRT